MVYQKLTAMLGKNCNIKILPEPKRRKIITKLSVRSVTIPEYQSKKDYGDSYMSVTSEI